MSALIWALVLILLFLSPVIALFVVLVVKEIRSTRARRRRLAAIAQRFS